jgi:putative ABC transport system permease protein
MLTDFRYALRSLSKTPGFATVAVLVAALGIGAATAMFSVVNALVLRPVPLPNAEQLVVVYETNLPRNVPLFSASYPNFADWRDRSKSWESLAAVGGRGMTLTGNSEPKFIYGRTMTANFLPTLGVVPNLGRNFLPEEDRPGHNQVAIISHAFWQHHLNGRTDVVGRSLILNGFSHTIVGVLGAETYFPGEMEIAVPMAADVTSERRMNHEIEVYGRLKRGVTLEQADGEMKAVAARIWTEHPEMDHGWSTQLVPLAHEIVGKEVRTGLSILLGAVGLLLLIAAANLSNLLLIRASARAHEVAIRTALGASRWRVVRQLVTESLVVTAVGGFLGVLLSLWAVDFLRSSELPRAAEISVDFRVLSVACFVTLLVGLLAGLAPALKSAQARPQEALKNQAPRAGRRAGMRDVMVVAQLAVSLALLVSAALLIRSFDHLLRVNPGFATERVLTVSMRPMDDENAIPFYERVTARIAALPEVAGVGMISSLPLTTNNTSNNVFPVGPSVVAAGESIQSSWRLVDGGYFDAMQIPVLRGRSFAGLSPNEARRSVVLSASLARMLFGEENPLGREIANVQISGQRLTVIGVVGDVRSARLGMSPAPAFYWSIHRFLYGPMQVVVRTTGEVQPLAAAIRRVSKEVDPSVPVFHIRTMNEVRAESVAREHFITALLGGFAATALLLSALGVYGVLAFSVQQRSQEIGVRLALGAQANDILRLILGQGFRLVALGAALGLVGAFAGGRLLSTMLYETETTDPTSFLIATIVLTSAALAASLVPARRATSVDPMVALRTE